MKRVSKWAGANTCFCLCQTHQAIELQTCMLNFLTWPVQFHLINCWSELWIGHPQENPFFCYPNFTINKWTFAHCLLPIMVFTLFFFFHLFGIIAHALFNSWKENTVRSVHVKIRIETRLDYCCVLILLWKSDAISLILDPPYVQALWILLSGTAFLI